MNYLSPLFYKCPVVRLANDDISTKREVVGCANDFTIQDDWVQLTPLGDFPHPIGLQRVDDEACRQMENTFNEGVKGMANRFIGLPWYIGHPDVDRKIYPNDACYGRIKAVEARLDNTDIKKRGLYGQVKFGTEGKALIDDGKYGYHSPVWDGEVIGMQGGKRIVRPFKLLSAGFTNQPRITVLPLANDELAQAELVYRELQHIGDDVPSEVLRPRIEALLANAGTSEGARKGWVARRAGMASTAKSKAAVKVAARNTKESKAKGVLKKSAAKVTPPPLPKPTATPPPLPTAQPAPTPNLAARVAARASKFFNRSKGAA